MYSPDDIPVSQYGGGRSYGTAATNRGSHEHPGHDQTKVKVTKELFPVDLEAESPGSQSTQDMVDTSEEDPNMSGEKEKDKDGAPNGVVESGKVQLQQNLGLLNGVAMIVGVIVGSGIFVSPAGVLSQTGSVGLALIVWTVSGLICLLGAVCFAELGTMIVSSGGMYSYIQEAFGGLPSFLYLWISLLITFPAANAVIALTCGFYILQPLYPCGSPDSAVRLIAAMSITLLTFVNCMSVKASMRVQDIFTVIKTLALVIIIITGIVVLVQGKVENFEDAFKDSYYSPGKISVAFYSGLFSYSGWYTLNFLTEELKNPYKNLPRAIWISMPMVTFIYVMSNVAYFVVLTPHEILSSEAVAVTFAQRKFGVMSWVMPVFVALSCFGSLNGCIMSVSRMFYVGAREGHLPDMLSLIHVKKYTPIPSLIFEGLASVAMLITSDVFLLINIVSFVEAMSFLVCTAALLYLRYKQPDRHRPIKVNIVLPIIFLIVCIFLVVFPIMTTPYDTGIGIIILLTGIPVYVVGVMWKTKPKSFVRFMSKLTLGAQKLIISVPDQSEKKND